ncbi:MAG: sigma-70 family RNA polymerase sigma factor [Melioribacteraceae bacterium]|nr:sigma-70 family RNA polymerase sigma factor [Melioribacteraceae bacterium]
MEKEKVVDKKNELMLKSIEPMIWSIIHRYNNIPKEEKEDIFQNSCLFVIEKIIPKYDPSKGVKFSVFAFRCISNLVQHNCIKYQKYKSYVFSGEDLFMKDFPFIDSNCEESEKKSFDEERIKNLRLMIDDNSPECYLKENEKNVLKLIFENPKITQREISEKLNYSYPSAVSAILNRMRKRIKTDKKF